VKAAEKEHRRREHETNGFDVPCLGRFCVLGAACAVSFLWGITEK
jgi:hypothetical protein